MMMRWTTLVLPALLAPALLGAQQNQIPQPRLYALQPAGAKAGTTVEVRLTSGAEIDGVDRLLFSHPGIKAEPVTVGPDRLFPEAR
ncbi:MAG TPA: hypothetical protein VEJ18_14540, partial [Planctomycetota bacterium]|nr:hypothetical protein [Planctomycetota bacterium]